jgi:hypothetical protein
MTQAIIPINPNSTTFSTDSFSSLGRRLSCLTKIEAQSAWKLQKSHFRKYPNSSHHSKKSRHHTYDLLCVKFKHLLKSRSNHYELSKAVKIKVVVINLINCNTGTQVKISPRPVRKSEALPNRKFEFLLVKYNRRSM